MKNVVKLKKIVLGGHEPDRTFQNSFLVRFYDLSGSFVPFVITIHPFCGYWDFVWDQLVKPAGFEFYIYKKR